MPTCHRRHVGASGNARTDERFVDQKTLARPLSLLHYPQLKRADASRDITTSGLIPPSC